MSKQRSPRKASNDTRPTRQISYSAEQIKRATAPRSLPIYTEEEETIRQTLLRRGAKQTLDRIKGGQTDRGPAKRAAVRQGLIVEIYRGISPAGKVPPTSPNCLTSIIAGLESRGIHASEDTIKYDLKILGAARLRKAVEFWKQKPWYLWQAPDNPRSRRKLRQHCLASQSFVKHGVSNLKLSDKTLREMKAGRDCLARNQAIQKPNKPSQDRRNAD